MGFGINSIHYFTEALFCPTPLWWRHHIMSGWCRNHRNHGNLLSTDHTENTDFLMSHRNHENLKIIFNENLFCVIRVLRGLLLDDDAEGGAVMGFGGFDEDAFLVTTKLESMVWDERTSNCFIIEKKTLKAVSFSEYFYTFAVSESYLFISKSNTK